MPYLDRYPRQLSGGQRQRVAMGRAIVRDPQVFLFDEPLSNLDAKLRVQMRTEIKELHQRLKTTTIYVTHDQVEAMTMADKIVVMQAGRIEQVGAPLELFDRPANLFVAGFIGSPAMNMLKGKVRLGEKPVVEVDGVALPFAGSRQVSDGQEVIYGVRPEHIDIVAGRLSRAHLGGRADRLGDAGVPALRRKRDRRAVPRAPRFQAGRHAQSQAARRSRPSVRRRRPASGSSDHPDTPSGGDAPDNRSGGTSCSRGSARFSTPTCCMRCAPWAMATT